MYIITIYFITATILCSSNFNCSRKVR